jgi:hypothetical protein
LAVACLAACAGNPPPPPDTDRHRCVEIPGGLVECWLRQDETVGTHQHR